MTRDEAIAAGMAVYWDCEHESEADARVAFVASLAVCGFKVVPVNVTQKMGAAAWTAYTREHANWSDIYTAMLAAAQEDSRD